MARRGRNGELAAFMRVVRRAQVQKPLRVIARKWLRLRKQSRDLSIRELGLYGASHPQGGAPGLLVRRLLQYFPSGL
jgi:hypothetical protein